jgi:putative DNA primase/helicase
VTAESLASALQARKTGGYWMARCPAHNDRNPSLAISEQGGRVLVHCHAGCDQRDVIDAIKAIGVWESAPSAAAAKDRRIVATYDYTDERDDLLYQVVRYEPKNFMPRYPDGHGGWIWKKHPRQILYRLPEVLEAPIVFVTEGEKDVETLREYGFVATTNAGGANAPWLPGFTETLAGREVILVPDDDVPGWTRVKGIARALLGTASRIIVLDDIARHGAKDISDWFRAGHSECELIALLGAVRAI